MPKRKNLIGQQFDELTVIEMLYNYQNKHRTYCRCIGVDGKEYIVRQDALVSGATHSIHGACSSGKKHDITSQRFGNLVALNPTDRRSPNGCVLWECECDCGNHTYCTVSDLKRQHKTSCGCNITKYVDSLKRDIIGERFGLLTVIEEVFPENRYRRTVLCQCDCGNTHVCTVSDLTSNHTQSCGCMGASQGEYLIKRLLDDLNIVYVPQMRFTECRDIKTLPFDFYLPEYNVCIEYDGIQHFVSIEHWGGDEGLSIRKKHDDIKTKFCIQNNIRLIRIPYTMNNDDIYKTIINLTSPATITA